MSLDEELDRLSIQDSSSDSHQPNSTSSSSNHPPGPTHPDDHDPHSPPTSTTPSSLSSLESSVPAPEGDPTPVQPEAVQQHESPEEGPTDTTATTPTSQVTVKRQVSNSSLFESDSHLFDFIDDLDPQTMSWPSPPSSGVFLLCGNKKKSPRPTSGQSNGFQSPTKYNFLDDPSIDEEESLSGHEKAFEEYFRGSPLADEVEAGQDLSDKHLTVTEDKACKSETSPSVGRPVSSGKGPAPPPPTQTQLNAENYCHDTCPTCAHHKGPPGLGPPGDYPRSVRSASWCDQANKSVSIPFPHRNHYHVCPQYNMYNYGAHPHAKVKFFQVGYNTKLKKMPENWQRMKARYHARGGDKMKSHYASSHYYHHYGYEHGFGHDNWLSYALTPFPRTMWTMSYSVPSSYKSRKQFLGHMTSTGVGGMKDWDYSLCLCCVCCNCAKTNMTNCCCCYHCVHTTSACRRSDVLRMVPVPTTSGPAPVVSILKKKDKDGKTIHPPEVKIIPPPEFADVAKDGLEVKTTTETILLGPELGVEITEDVIPPPDVERGMHDQSQLIEQDFLLPDHLIREEDEDDDEEVTSNVTSGPTPITEPTDVGE